MTYLQSLRSALEQALADPKVVLCGQLVKYGLGGLTTGLAERFPRQVLTYPVCENLMNASAMGMALAGMRPVVIHERMDFVAVGMDALVNHIPVWPMREPMSLPVTILAVVGKGKGQGPQHSKDLTPWFRCFEGWIVRDPDSPEQAGAQLIESIFGQAPVMFVARRELFGTTERKAVSVPDRVGLCGASLRHETDFYRRAR